MEPVQLAAILAGAILIASTALSTTSLAVVYASTSLKMQRSGEAQLSIGPLLCARLVVRVGGGFDSKPPALRPANDVERQRVAPPAQMGYRQLEIVAAAQGPSIGGDE